MKNETLLPLINAITKIFKKQHLSYDQAIYVCKKARENAGIRRISKEASKIERLSEEEQTFLLKTAYKKSGNVGLLIKTLLLTGARINEFVNIVVNDFYFAEQIIIIRKAKGDTQRVVPITIRLAEEIKTYLKDRKQGYLFESKRNDKYSTRRIQQLVKSIAIQAGITKRVHPHLLRHTVATFLLENGMSFENVQIFLGHKRIENTRIYAKSSAYQIQAEYQQAMKLF